MLCREVIPVCSEIPTKHLNTPCGPNVTILTLNLEVPIVTTGLWSVKEMKTTVSNSHNRRNL